MRRFVLTISEEEMITIIKALTKYEKGYVANKKNGKAEAEAAAILISKFHQLVNG